ncbi:MAG: DnaA/Hda family protein, partial [Spirochaetota bacterium]|nr:DnaA/Hda family protein [Spirochaetota bacterium]
MTFDNLVKGEFNRFAYSAATAIVEKSMKINPLLVQSETGLGKTHLLQAILSKATEESPNEKHIFVTSESFILDYIAALKQNTQGAFRQKYRNNQLLIIDDIQFLAGKDAAQDEISLTFDHLQDHDVQIVLSADCSIDKIPG